MSRARRIERFKRQHRKAGPVIIFGYRDAAATYMRVTKSRGPVIEGRHQVYALDATKPWHVIEVYGAHDPIIQDARRVFELRRSGAPGMRDFAVQSAA